MESLYVLPGYLRHTGDLLDTVHRRIVVFFFPPSAGSILQQPFVPLLALPLMGENHTHCSNVSEIFWHFVVSFTQHYYPIVKH